MPKISQIDEVPCQAEVRILQKTTLNKLKEVIDWESKHLQMGKSPLRFSRGKLYIDGALYRKT